MGNNPVIDYQVRGPFRGFRSNYNFKKEEGGFPEGIVRPDTINFT